MAGINSRFRSLRLCHGLRELRGSLAWLIATRVWVGLASFFVVFNILVFLQERSEIRKQTRILLAESNLYMSMRFHGSTDRVFEVLQALDFQLHSATPDKEAQANDIAELKAILPFSRIHLVTKNASDADSAWLSKSKTFLIPHRDHNHPFIGNQRGASTSLTYFLDPAKTQSFVCFNRRSKYAEDPSSAADAPRIISACWTAKDFVRYVGYQRILLSLSQSSPASPVSSLDANSSLANSQGLFLLAGSNGNIFLPASQQLIETKRENIVSFLESREKRFSSPEWLKVYQYMNGFHSRPMGSTQFDTISIHGESYLIQSLRLGPYWSSAILLPASTAYRHVRIHSLILSLQQLIALALVTWIVFSTSRMIARPISQAISAIKRLSDGETSIALPETARGELQLLYNSIRETSSQLQLLMADKVSNALRNQQLSTAREIQKTFLPAGELESNDYSVAATFMPAYDVGADWFDIIESQGLIFVVIADVCDKGVPSALFMSVFRSLLRFTLEDDCADGQLDIDSILKDALERVNLYMAQKHGAQAMFATVFLAAFNPSTMLLHYVSAGHEPALLLTAGTVEELKGVSPAVGIFENASYLSHSIHVRDGDILFAYTDGLTDAINAQEERWGKERLRHALVSWSGMRDAKVIISSIQAEVNQFIDGCDQFDDLTLLALVVKTSAIPVSPLPAQAPA